MTGNVRRYTPLPLQGDYWSGYPLMKPSEPTLATPQPGNGV